MEEKWKRREKRRRCMASGETNSRNVRVSKSQARARPKPEHASAMFFSIWVAYLKMNSLPKFHSHEKWRAYPMLSLCWFQVIPKPFKSINMSLLKTLWLCCLKTHNLGIFPHSCNLHNWNMAVFHLCTSQEFIWLQSCVVYICTCALLVLNIIIQSLRNELKLF